MRNDKTENVKPLKRAGTLTARLLLLGGPCPTAASVAEPNSEGSETVDSSGSMRARKGNVPENLITNIQKYVLTRSWNWWNRRLSIFGRRSTRKSRNSKYEGPRTTLGFLQQISIKNYKSMIRIQSLAHLQFRHL